MTTLTAKAPLASHSILTRFVWKEYRALRPLWLAIFGATILLQLALLQLLAPNTDFVAALLATSLSAAVLYAVGAASTTFALEHEEETHGFLLGLPTTWWPVFAGKLLLVTVSALLLAVALSGVGMLLDGRDASQGRGLTTILGMLGIAIFEAIAWGTLFSLLVKRPIASAILAICVGAVVLNITVNLSSSYAVGATVPQAYVEAMPARLTIIALVLAASTALATNWLAIGTRTRAPLSFWSQIRRGGERAGVLGTRGGEVRAFKRALPRLLWQSWHDGWRLVAMPFLVAGFLALGILAAVGFTGSVAEDLLTSIGLPMLVFVPALYGALVFGGDQRRKQYRFLAEHAARPRVVWLARQIVWLGALTVVYLTVLLIVVVVGVRSIGLNAEDIRDRAYKWGYEVQMHDPWTVAWASEAALEIAGLGALGWLTAYALGQVCSMLVRSQILAAFAALVLSIVLCAWLAAVYLWNLSGLVFLVPLALGLLAFTWLRAPDWIAERRAWRSWTWPVAALAVPLVFIGMALPMVRLAQVPMYASAIIGPTIPAEFMPRPTTEQIIDFELAKFRAGITPAARETAELYRDIAERYDTGFSQTPLERWRKAQRAAMAGISMDDRNMRTDLPYIDAIVDETRVPEDELEAFRKEKLQFVENVRNTIPSTVEALMEVTDRPNCYFGDLKLQTIRWDSQDLRSYPPYQSLTHLIQLLRSAPSQLRELVGDRVNLDHIDAFERYLAALRMSTHIRSGQPSVIYLAQLHEERWILYFIGHWAQQTARSEEQLAQALQKLEAHFQAPPNLHNTLLADHLLVRNVIEGKEPPLSVDWESDAPLDPAYLAFLANELPWERERALEALDRVTLANLGEAHELTTQLDSISSDIAWIRERLRPRHWGGLPPAWQIEEPEAATSYLLSYEYAERVPLHELFRAYIDTILHRRAALVQVALARYRLEHGSYPAQLSALAPDYIDELPVDPYTRQPFHYRPEGLDLPLRTYGHLGLIDANTPLFWSAVGNVSLQRTSERAADPGDGHGGDEEELERTFVYTLRGDASHWWYEPYFVFPLAK